MAYPQDGFAYPQGGCAIIKIIMDAWQITPTQNIKLQSGTVSLDEFTRQLPDGYYSTFRTFDGGRRVLGFSAHLRRLYEPIPPTEVDESYLRRQLFSLLEPYRSGEARVRLIMTQQGQVYIAMETLKSLPPEVYERGIRVETTELQRQLPRLKSTAFIGSSESERKHIAQQGILEALLVKEGKILEGLTSNFFYVKDNILYTAQDDILLGVTRNTVIYVAQGRGVAVNYEPLRRNQLRTIDEAFITSSSRGVVPVIQIDKVTVGQGSPGPLTRRLSMGYDQYIKVNAERILPID
jgi:branched-chain amino acid aminotransferase